MLQSKKADIIIEIGAAKIYVLANEIARRTVGSPRSYVGKIFHVKYK